MRVAELHTGEALRLETLQAYHILDTPQEAAFEELVQLVQALTHCPMAAISFMDRDRQWFKAERGLGLSSVERNFSLCNNTLREPSGLHVEDLSTDERFAAHPMVSGGLCLRFYAGSKILAAGGVALGTVCVFDTQPRTFSAEQVRCLEIIAAQVSRLLEARLQTLSLRKRAEALIQLEQRTVQRSLEAQEEDRQRLGYRLHEGMAQTLAACHTFLCLAEKQPGKRLQLVQATRQELHGLIKEVRNVTRTLTPTTMEQFSLCDALEQLVADFSPRAGFSIRLEEEGDCRKINRTKALALYRNVEEYLQELQQAGDVSAALVRLRISSEAALLLMDNRPPRSSEQLENDTLVRTLFNRTVGYGGTVKYKHFAVKGNALLITFPIGGQA